MDTNGALILIDMQQEEFACLPKEKIPRFEQAAHKLLESYRFNNRAIIHAFMSLNPPSVLVEKIPEDWEQSKSYNHIASCGSQCDLRPHEKFTPQAGEGVVLKDYLSAFTATELNVFLKKNGIENISVAGLQAHKCVLQTVLEGLSRGFKCTVYTETTTCPKDDQYERAIEKMRESGVRVVSVYGGS